MRESVQGTLTEKLFSVNGVWTTAYHYGKDKPQPIICSGCKVMWSEWITCNMPEYKH